MPEIELDRKLLKAGLSVKVVVVRGDGKVVQTVSWSTAVTRLIGQVLRALPSKRFGQDKRDGKIAKALKRAGDAEKVRYLAIGRKPWVWR